MTVIALDEYLLKSKIHCMSYFLLIIQSLTVWHGERGTAIRNKPRMALANCRPNVSAELCLNGIFCIICFLIISHSLESEGGKCVVIFVCWCSPMFPLERRERERDQNKKKLYDKDKYRRMTDSQPHFV